MDRPRGISQAVFVIWITIIINVIGEIIDLGLGKASVIEFLVALAVFAVFSIIPYKISEGSNVARQCFIALFILYALSMLIFLSGIDTDSFNLTTADVVVSIALLPANLFILYRLLQPDASSWFSEQEQNSNDDGVKIEYPTILRRYFATFIDGWLTIAMLFAVTYFIGGKENAFFRLIVAALILLGYEPLFTSKFCTLGQKIMGIKIRKAVDYRRLNYPAALLRFIIKWIFGFISLFIIIFSKERRALHDYASGSIVVYSSLSNHNQQGAVNVIKSSNQGKTAEILILF